VLTFPEALERVRITLADLEGQEPERQGLVAQREGGQGQELGGTAGGGSRGRTDTGGTAGGGTATERAGGG